MRPHEWREGEVFVFGSNLRGIHGGGAAKFAFDHCGATWGQGVGLSNSSYALPTCERPGVPLPRQAIRQHAEVFKAFAVSHPELSFFLTRVGCGIAGFTDAEIAPLFKGVSDNVRTPPEWAEWL